MRCINGNRLSRKGFCVCSAGEVLADFLRTETRKESNLAGRWALSGRRDMACGTRKIGRIPAQCGESTDVKKPNREGLGFEYGGTTECERFLRTGSDSLVQTHAASGVAVRQKSRATNPPQKTASIPYPAAASPRAVTLPGTRSAAQHAAWTWRSPLASAMPGTMTAWDPIHHKEFTMTTTHFDQLQLAER